MSRRSHQWFDMICIVSRDALSKANLLTPCLCWMLGEDGQRTIKIAKVSIYWTNVGGVFEMWIKRLARRVAVGNTWMDCTTPCVFWLRRLIHFKQIPVVSSIWPSVKCRATLVERSQLPHVSSTHSWVDRSTAFAAWRFLCFSKGLHAIAYADNLNASIASGQGLAGQRYLRLTGTMRKQINPKRQRTLRAMGMSCSGSIVLTCKALNNNHESLACMLNIHELATLVVHGDTIHGENPAPVDMMYIPAHPIKHSNYSIFTIPASAGQCLSIVRASQTHCFLHNAL